LHRRKEYLSVTVVKRLVWLLLLAFGTAIAQVQPVDVRLVPEEKCSCCEQPGDCGMSECGLPPAAAQPVLQVASPAPVVRVAVKRAAPAPRVVREKFYAQFLPRVRVVPAVPAYTAVASPASVPLFQEHCSWLI
jgi:hypothetical protein